MSKVAIAILAAGSSSRLGRAKQLVELGGETLISRSIESAKGADPIATIVVLGAGCSQIARRIRQDVMLVENHDWQEGIASSIRCAVEAASALPLEALIITTCDQPYVTGDLLQKIKELFERTGRSIVSAFYNGSPGIPALFARDKFGDLLTLRGDRGAKKIITQSDALYVDAPQAAIDLDTEEDIVFHSRLFIQERQHTPA